MRLSKRIYKIADMIACGETAADIGTDHGYVPMLLFKNGISPRVIMSDISEGSLAKAVETFENSGLIVDPDDFRCGDGLEPINCGEVDAIIIGGLGGHTIADILDVDPVKSRSFKKIVLQPRKHSGNLRHYLYTHGWDIIEDTLAEEGKFQCEIIVAKPAEVNSRVEKYPADDIRWKYPADTATASPVLAAKRIDWKLSSIDKQISNLEAGTSKSIHKISRLQEEKKYLKELLKMTGDNSTSTDN